MTATAVDQEIMALERQFWDSMKSKDASVGQRLTGDQCIVAGAQGVSAFKAEDMPGMMEMGNWKLKAYDFSDVTFIKPASNVAIIGYHVKEDLDVDDKPVTLEANATSVWTQKDGKWACSLHTESVAGDPYGRDRKQM
jgi:hypothetical protein